MSDAEIRSSLDQVLSLVDERVARWFERAGMSEPRDLLNAMAEDALTYLVPTER